MIKRLIVTADDYGMCESVNQAIEECLAAGTLRATCVMANMPFYPSASALRQKFPQSSIGIHWNLTQGRPILPHAKVFSLTNSDGCFLHPVEFRRRWWSRKVILNELQAELQAQFHRLREVIGPLDFWNTHENVHVFPGIFRAFVELGQSLGIPAMRCHRRLTVPHGTTPLLYNLRYPHYWAKGQVISWLSSRAQARGILMPDARVYSPGLNGAPTLLEEVIERVPWNRVQKAIEIVIHPATMVDSDLFGDLTESRVREYQVFRNPRLLDHLTKKGIKPVGFEALRISRNSQLKNL